MYGDNYQSYGLFPTTNKQGKKEISFLVSHGYWQEYKSRVARYSIRPDGFVSLHAKYAGGMHHEALYFQRLTPER